MRKLIVPAAVCASAMLFATPQSANADHLRSGAPGYGSSYAPGYGGIYSGGYGGGFGGGYVGQGGYGGVGGAPYGAGPSYCPLDSYGGSSGSYGGGYGNRYIDPYLGARPQHQAYDRHNVILRSGSFGFYYGR